MNWATKKPQPGEFYESKAESLRINPENGLTWHETYLIALQRWNRRQLKAKK